MLKSCCEEDAETANALILAAGMQMPQNSLTLVVDESGMYYRVPICMINELADLPMKSGLTSSASS